MSCPLALLSQNPSLRQALTPSQIRKRTTSHLCRNKRSTQTHTDPPRHVRTTARDTYTQQKQNQHHAADRRRPSSAARLARPPPLDVIDRSMQDASKVAATLSVTFALGVVTGWLLNSYTRKVRVARVSLARARDEAVVSPSSSPKKTGALTPSIAASPLPTPQTQNTTGLGGYAQQAAEQGQADLSVATWRRARAPGGRTIKRVVAVANAPPSPSLEQAPRNESDNNNELQRDVPPPFCTSVLFPVASRVDRFHH